MQRRISCILAVLAGASAARVSRRTTFSLPAAAAAVTPLGSIAQVAWAEDAVTTAETAAPVAETAVAEIAPAMPAVADELVPPPPPLAPPPPPLTSAFDFDVPFRGEPRDIKPFIGTANIVVNVKYDDPVTLEQLPGLISLHERFSMSGLHVLAFPTDQGWFEAEDSNTLRLMFKSTYDFGQYPSAVVFDKADLLGTNALPLYSWLTGEEPNPWGVNRIVFNYEKFLLDAKGQPLRRYPRKFPISLMEPDVQAVLAGLPLPPPSERLVKAWEDAKREAIKSEYAFKPGLNYYKKGSPAS